MGRPRQFDETTVLEAAMHRFWAVGYDTTSVRDLAADMGLTNASLYHAFGDKAALYRRALDHYLRHSVHERIARFERNHSPLAAIRGFLDEIVARSLADPQHCGCMLINAALEQAPHDPAIRDLVATEFAAIEAFFRRCATAGQQDGSIARQIPPEQIAQLLLSTLIGLRVLARVRPEPALLTGTAAAALAALHPR